MDEHNKLEERKISPHEKMHKINDNAYMFRFPNHLRTNDVFDVQQ